MNLTGFRTMQARLHVQALLAQSPRGVYPFGNEPCAIRRGSVAYEYVVYGGVVECLFDVNGLFS